MNFFINIVAIYLIINLTYIASGYSSEIELPNHVVKEIESDYSNKSETKMGLYFTSVETDQVFQFKSSNNTFKVVPFAFIPIESGGGRRKCLIRVLKMPNYQVLQDLETSLNDQNKLPCNGVLALSFKDVNSDRVNDIIALYDFTTAGNKSIEPDVVVYTYEPVSQKFILNQALSLKAAGNRVRNMRDALKNLRGTK